MDLRKSTSVKDRRQRLERELGITLPGIGAASLDESVAAKKNCENMVGTVHLPVGIAGPLKIDSRDYYLPLATTEGALVASVNRGCKAIFTSGGVKVVVNRAGTTRGPVFRVTGLGQAETLKTFLAKNLSELKQIAARSSPFISLETLTTKVVGRNFYIRFVFNTQDAMGMNMATISTRDMVDFITEKTGIRCLSLSGNFCVDKKPSWLNFLSGRGFEVSAEVVISESVLSEVLKTTAQAVYDVWLAKCLIGSAVSGSMGFNAHFANVIAALFAATGQDLAHVVEGSLGTTIVEVSGADLYVCVNLPDLMLGTIGGGTGLTTQKESLSIMGIAPGSDSTQLVKVVGGAVLAGEISLLSSLSEDSLVAAHVKLGRGE